MLEALLEEDLMDDVNTKTEAVEAKPVDETKPVADTDLTKPPTPPEPPTKWKVPEEIGNLLKALDGECAELQRRLGRLEFDYVNNKGALMKDLDAKLGQFNSMLNAAAKAGGLDDRMPWRLDFQTMTLLRR